MSCWFWNIDKSNQQYFASEIRSGRLRQGWGYDQRLDMRLIAKKADDACDDEEWRAWERVGPMLEDIQLGDLIAVKNVPDNQSFTLVRVAGPYRFDLGAIGDFGHCLPIELIRVFNKYSKIVPSTLANALNREQNPIRITYKHEATLIKLAALGEKVDEETESPEPFKKKWETWRLAALPALRDALRTSLTPSEAEKLILEMLRHDGLDVIWSAGSGEKGADLLTTIQLGYGLDTYLAIQVKMHWDTDHDTTGIEQIEWAFREHRVQAGLLVTFADALGDGLVARIEQAKSRHNIEVLYGEELYIRLLAAISDQGFDVA